jgi:hypothetical protein
MRAMDVRHRPTARVAISAPARLAGLALGLAGCPTQLTPTEQVLDFGEFFLPGRYLDTAPVDNPTSSLVTVGAISFDTGIAFALETGLPLAMDERAAYPLDFAFEAPPGEFGEWTDLAHLSVAPGKGEPYELLIELRALLTEGDADGDGHVSAAYGGDDCDDSDRDRFLGNPEICDGKDNDCDGEMGPEEVDDDDDGTLSCFDCDDGDATVHPGADEGCDYIDTDCDGSVGEAETDPDGDNVSECDGDCEPDVFDVNPNNPEACDGYDTDCSAGGIVPPNELDLDEDGWFPCNGDCDDENRFANPGNVEEACDGFDTDCDNITPQDESDEDGDGVLPCGGDCNDEQDSVGPGFPEICDGFDSDCDGVTPADEVDTDSDGFFDCEDCDPGNSSIFPGNIEVCDGLDNDCNSTVDDGFDNDGDTYSSCAGDCDDGDIAVNPAATDGCDGIDNDCDGELVLGEEFDSDNDGLLDCADTDCPMYVDAAFSGSSDGSAASPWSSIQDGLAATAVGSCVTLWVAPGNYVGPVDWPSSGLDSRVIAQQGAAQTTIDAGGSGTAGVIVDSGQTTAALLRGFTVIGGNVVGDGGGVQVLASSLTVEDCVVTGNIASGNGGGLYASGGPLVLLDSEFSGNTAGSNGGGAYIQQGAPTITGCLFDGNTATLLDGGGLHVAAGGSGVLIQGSSFAGNSAGDDGGGAFLNGLDGNVLQNVFADNAANTGDNGWGGGVIIHQPSGLLIFSNNIVNANMAGEGAGLFVFDGAPQVDNNTFVDNVASDTLDPSTVRIFDGIYRNNAICNGVGYGVRIVGVTAFAYNDVFGFTDGLYDGTTDFTGTDGNLSVGAGFVAFGEDGDGGNDDLHLLPGSPLVDSGNPATSFNDWNGSRNDIGAYGGPDGSWP